MEYPLSIEEQLENLARYLDERRNVILQAWREAVEGDSRLTTVSRMGRVDFEDNIPGSLQGLSLQLRLRTKISQEGTADGNPEASFGEQEEAKHAHEHGTHRWQEGYDIRELMLEWGHLHFCLVRILNDYELANPIVNREAMNWARLAIAELINGGYSQSVLQYDSLQQTEAQEIVHGLTDALQQIGRWEQQRGQVLREAIHDLRGNLSVVQATTNILETTSGADQATQNAIFDVLQLGTSTLNQMLTELLDLARLEAGQEARKIESFDVAALLGELCEVSTPLAQNNGLYLNYSSASQLVVQGDTIKIQRIAQNLILNAIKYTPRGGLTVHWAASEPNQWYLSVEDTGPGVAASKESPSIVQEIVDASMSYPTAETSTLGPTAVRSEGVGLAIVKRLCALLDAKLEIESAETGTIFRVTFPRQYHE